MRTYKRITTDEYRILQHTPAGWEVVCVETTNREARQRLLEYILNQPQYPLRCIKRRVKIAQ